LNASLRRSSAAHWASRSRKPEPVSADHQPIARGRDGGDIQVTSTVGTGSTFRVKMLLSEVTNPTRTAPVDAPFSVTMGRARRS